MFLPLDFPLFGITIDDQPSYFLYRGNEKIVPLFTRESTLLAFIASHPEWSRDDITRIDIKDASGFFEVADDVKAHTDHMSLDPRSDTDYMPCYSIKSVKQFCRDLN